MPSMPMSIASSNIYIYIIYNSLIYLVDSYRKHIYNSRLL